MSFEDVDEPTIGSGDAGGPDSGATVQGPLDANPDRAERVSAPSDAFQALGNEIRLEILETVLAETRGTDAERVQFSTLFEETDVDTSAGFAYHLEQLVGPYLRKHDDGYELTYAGLQVARAIATGAYTHRVDHPPVPLSDACPFCDREALAARSTDNVVTIACRECERSLLRLGFPPSGLDAHGETFPEAFDRHHRHRLSLMHDGVCPECSGDVTARLVTPATAVADELPAELTDHVQAEFECGCCGTEVRCPVTLALLDHPAIVSFYHEHGQDVRNRPIWNVGHEWSETILSEEPLAVRVTATLGDDVLALYVGAGVDVVDVQRSAADA
ncbi:DUF7351 domain-containing protein [Halosolutus halophilus]|uniref:DUF7351 domain-containing protein n=1 Tax=Halosolutus halophilus TaxID=1552990 RepID=UPI0022352974|nr:ArsR family transcriptional regulator [Halosolutus halophilus]